MGRSTGVQVNAVTKSGSNQLSGLFRGNFRNSKFNAENPVLGRVEPIDNQQLSRTLGGPILLNRLHYFANYEYEREPKTFIFNTPYPAFNIDMNGTDSQKKGGFRLDYQLSSKTRLMGKFSRAVLWQPVVPANLQSSPAATGTNREYNDEGPRPVHAGPEQQGAERDQSGRSDLRHLEREHHHMVEPLAGRQRHQHRLAPHHLHELRDCGQPVLSAASGSVGLERAGRFHILVRRARTSRPQGRRGISASPSDSGQLPAVHGHDRTPGTGPTPANLVALFPGSVQRRHLEPRGDLLDHAELPASASATSTSISIRRSSRAGCRTIGRSAIA